jgi:hypothetical protein
MPRSGNARKELCMRLSWWFRLMPEIAELRNIDPSGSVPHKMTMAPSEPPLGLSYRWRGFANPRISRLGPRFLQSSLQTLGFPMSWFLSPRRRTVRNRGGLSASSTPIGFTRPLPAGCWRIHDCQPLLLSLALKQLPPRYRLRNLDGNWRCRDSVLRNVAPG